MPLGLAGALMLTTACLEDTAWNLGAPSPSGGAGPVLHLLQLLGALPAEFTAQTCRERSVRPGERRHPQTTVRTQQNETHLAGTASGHEGDGSFPVATSAQGNTEAADLGALMSERSWRI